MHQLLNQRFLFFARSLLSLHQRFDTVLLLQQLLNAGERALRRFWIVRLSSIPAFAFEFEFVHFNLRARFAAHGL